MPGYMPFMVMPQMEQSVPASPLEIIPARVRVAMELLRDLTLKVMPRVAVNDVAIETLDAMKLEMAEVHARDAACDLLISYMKGEVKPDWWERKKNTPDKGGTVITCVACMPGPAKTSCVLCRGAGQLIVRPTSDVERG